jgi:toxin CcdB
MARYDVHLNPSGPGCLLDCQADLLSGLTTRLVVPLLPPDVAPIPSRRLNPSFVVGEDRLIMMTHFAASVPTRALGERIGSLADQHDAIIEAFDMLLTGY